MVDAAGQDDQVTLLKPYPHPVVSLASDVEETSTVEDVSDLFVLV